MNNDAAELDSLGQLSIIAVVVTHLARYYQSIGKRSLQSALSSYGLAANKSYGYFSERLSFHAQILSKYPRY